MKVAELAARVDLTPEEIAEILELFLDTSSKNLGSLRAALQEKDRLKILSYAHSIKGAAGNLGLTEIYEIAREMERNAANHNLVKVQEAMGTIQEKINGLGAMIRGMRSPALQG